MDEVECARGGNPKPPKVDTIIKWVMTAWNKVNESAILNSIKVAGFDNETKWHTYKHDVHGSTFRNAWLSIDLFGTEDTVQLIENEGEEDENVILYIEAFI